MTHWNGPRVNARNATSQMPRAVVESLENRTLLSADYTNRGVVSIIVDETLAADLSVELDLTPMS